MIKDQYPESELTGKIIGCAIEVHKFFGNGFQEVIYQRSLAIEMKKQGLAFSREHEMDIFYKEEYVGKRRGRFFCGGEDNGRIESYYFMGRCTPYPGNKLPGSL
jgi:hypothetical protein